MNQEVLSKLKRELLLIAVIFVIFILLFKLIFIKEDFIVIIKIIASIFWLFVLPGYSVLFYWHYKIGFIERIVIGIALSAAIIGIFSYYLGLLGLDIIYHSIILPLIIIIAGFIIVFRYLKK